MNSLIQIQKSNPILISIIVLTIAALFPMAVHLIPPVNGIPIGAYLLPMFYIPLLTLVLMGRNFAYITAALAPVINFAVAGNNNWEFMSILTLELVVFTVFTAFLISRIKFLAIPISILFAKLISSLFIGLSSLLPVTPWDYFQATLYNGLPGITILTVMAYFILKFRDDSNGENRPV